MKFSIAAVILLFVINCVNAQNLVPNPSFEDTVYCSDFGRISGCENWVNCRETPDYDHACHSGAFSVPYNTIGYQPAATGNAYCQIWTYAANQLYREYIGVSLLQPMVIGHTYDVSFKCAPGNIETGYCVKTDKLGIRFSTVPFDSAYPAPIDNFAHVYTNDVVSDTLNWTIVGSTFTADSAYTFLVVGNFFDDASTDTVGPCWGFGVYYIDDVAVLDSSTGIHEAVSKNKLSLSKAGGTLAISIDNDLPHSIDIYNALGQLRYSTNDLITSPALIDVSSFASGMYVLQVQFKSQTLTTAWFNF